MKYIRRAFADAFQGQLVRTVLLSILGAIITLAAFRLFISADRALAETPGLLIGVAGVLGSLLFLFLWCLAIAPYRMEREARISAESKLSDLQEALDQKAQKRRLSGEEKALLTDAIRQSGVRPNEINVLFDPLDAWCADFACDISDAIKAAGIESLVHDGAMLTRDPRDRGLKVYHGGKGTVKALADKVHEAFLTLGIHAERRNAEDDGNFFIDVCRGDY
ncbi:MAG: hypothetical protein AB3N15_10485 [Paracoccaceae bacterium]